MNKVILLGRMARDPEVRFTQAAEPLAVCRFAVAVDRPYKKENEETVDFINCVSFGKRAENIGKYFRKGNRIAICGRLQVSSYTDKQGNKKYSTDVLVEDFDFCETKTSEGKASNSEPTQGYSEQNVDDNEDLPFN